MKKQLIADISEDRIAQLSNDLSEGIHSGTVAEWRKVALYFREKSDIQYRNIISIKDIIIRNELEYFLAGT